MKAAALALMLAAAAPAAAQQSTLPTPAQQVSAMGQVLAAHGMSPAGVEKAKAIIQANGVRMRGLVQRVAEAGRALHTVAASTPFNASAFEGAMRAHRAAMLAATAATEDANLDVFRQLSPADKQVFARTVTGTPRQAH